MKNSNQSMNSNSVWFYCFGNYKESTAIYKIELFQRDRARGDLCTKKSLLEGIPVSCFTATAKQKVIEDIRDYFKEKLSLELEVFSSNASRSNLHYEVFEKHDEEDKYNTLRNMIEEKNCSTIIYVSRTRKAEVLAQRLNQDGYQARAYHGQMDKQEKTENQDTEREVRIVLPELYFEKK